MDKMSEGKKPREFWIHNVMTESNGEVPVAFSFHKPKPSTHVIEKSAYTKAIQIAKELRYYVQHIGECEVFDDVPCSCGLDMHLSNLKELS